MTKIDAKYISTRKLKKGHCYPIPPKALGLVLSDTAQANLGRVSYMLQTSKQTLISAHYNGKSATDWGTIDLALFSTPLEEREEARKSLVQNILPALEVWITAVAQKDEYQRRLDHSILFRVVNGETIIEEGPGNWLQ